LFEFSCVFVFDWVLQTSVVPVSFSGNDCSSDYIATVPDAHLDAERPIRFNDGKVDFQGRLWAGTMAMDPTKNPESGRFYCLQRAGSVTGTEIATPYDLVEKLGPVGISNGTEWDGQYMYYIDSLQPVWHSLHFNVELVQSVELS
jgi:sugar lactone lactonase YvrE